ncbi:MAG TPA: hypothetical protein VKX49_07620 [Bryobacteraceae bacterium]|nr:hypothetical protein [Bryobacteraceae bacterium]
MKKIAIGLLLTSGFLFAHGRRDATTTTDQDNYTLRKETHMAWYTRSALHTQSPPIHLAKVRNHEVMKPGDQLQINKTTITAFVHSNK